MTTTDPTPAPRPTGSHAADDGEFDRDPANDTTDSNDTPDTTYGAGFADAEPAGAASAGPTAADGPVLLPVDPPEDSRYDDTDYDDRSQGRADDWSGDQADDRTENRSDDVLPGEDRPADRADDGVFVAQSDHTDGLPLATAGAPADGSSADGSSADGARTDGAPTPVPDPSGSGPSSSPISSVGGPDWHELQSKFVDDPAAAVRDAADVVERALSDLRGRLETGDTEELRTAFRRYRDLYAGLS